MTESSGTDSYCCRLSSCGRLFSFKPDNSALEIDERLFVPLRDVDPSATAYSTAASNAAVLAMGAKDELFLRLIRCVALAAPSELECARETD